MTDRDSRPDGRASSASTSWPAGDRAGRPTTAVDDAGRSTSLGAASALRRLRRNPVVLVGAVIIGLFVAAGDHRAADRAARPDVPSSLLDQVRPQSNPIPGPQPGFPLGADHRAATCSPG